jgi:hypothetical protein
MSKPMGKYFDYNEFISDFTDGYFDASERKEIFISTGYKYGGM